MSAKPSKSEVGLDGEKEKTVCHCRKQLEGHDEIIDAHSASEVEVAGIITDANITWEARVGA